MSSFYMPVSALPFNAVSSVNVSHSTITQYNRIYLILPVYRKREAKWHYKVLLGEVKRNMSLSRGLQIVNIIQKRPLLFNSLVYGVFYTGAEFIRQSFDKTPKLIVKKPENAADVKGPILMEIQRLCEILDLVDEKKDSLIQSTTYNRPQLKRYAVYGCLLAGPVLHGWYKWLDTLYTGRSIKIALKKLLVDQFVFTPLLISFFFISMSLMEAQPDILKECKIKFLHTFQTSCAFWLPVQLANFMLVPPSLRVTYVSVASFCWVNILCCLKNVPIAEREKKVKN